MPQEISNLDDMSVALALPDSEPQTPLTPANLLAPNPRQFGIPAELASDAFFLHDLHGRFLDVNNQACQMLGYTRRELLTLGVFDISVEYNYQSALDVWRTIIPGKTVTIRGHERRKDGSIFPTEARLSGYLLEGQLHIIALVRDISVSTRAEQSARASQDQYRVLLDSIDEAFCVLDILCDDQGHPIDYRFLEVNPAFEKHVGILNAVGHTIRELNPGIEQKWIDTYHQVATTGQATRFKEESASLGLFFDVYAFRVGTPDQHHVACLFTNITERINAEKALVKSEKLALVGLLSGVISHEIRNPIDSIDNLFYLATDEPDVDTLHEYIRMAQGELKRISNIITHTLHFNRQSFTPTTESLSGVLDSAIAVYDFRIRQTSVTLHRDYAPDDSISCLASELRQVFMNLIVNAFEATPQGGTVTLKTRPTTGWKTGEPGVRVTIADTGQGMSEETRHRLFEAFYTTKGTTGTGLGLWVSREILHRHAAHVCVRSRQSPGRSGTIFHLWFPLTFAAKPSSHSTSTK